MITKIKRFYGHVELRIPNKPWWYTAEIGDLYVNKNIVIKVMVKV